MFRKSATRGRSIICNPNFIDYRASADFHYILRKFLAFSESAAAQAGLTSQQHQALLTVKGIAGDEGLSAGALAERLLIRQHSAVELLDRLEHAGLIERIADPQEGQGVLFRVTIDGANCLLSLTTTHLDEIRSIGPSLMEVLRDLSAANPE